MEKVDTTVRGVRYRARKRFRRYENPYGNPLYSLKAGMSYLFEEEMSKLINERVCPCCGQFSLGDFDW